MNLKDLNIEELPPNTLRIYSSNTKYKDFNSHTDYINNKGSNIIQRRVDGPSCLCNFYMHETKADLYIHYMINGEFINGRAGLWFKDGKLMNNGVHYYYDGKQLISIKNDKDYFKFLKMQVFK